MASATTSEESRPDPGEANGKFDCNICLETPRDPVITLCGHLFCWHCLYRVRLLSLLFANTTYRFLARATW